MPDRNRLLAIAVLVCCCQVSLATADSSIGTEGVFYLRAPDGSLEAKPHSDGDVILIRLANVTRDENVFIYEIRYIGFYAGVYDLRDFLRPSDGGDLSELPPAKVSIVSVLPPDHDGALAAIKAAALPSAWPYRGMLLAAIALWLTPLAWWVGRRFLNRDRVIPDRTLASRSLIDQLQPLVEDVIHGRSNPRDQATLERLLSQHWRERLGIHDCDSQSALARLRADHQAGQLLRSLEEWLHEPPGRREIDLHSLLAPYRTTAEVCA
jgi:hypothetical protein